MLYLSFSKWLLLLSFILVVGSASANVQVQLDQSIDQNCDGNAETVAEAPPGSCLLYTIRLLNTGPNTINNVLVTGRIPAQTRLMVPYQHEGITADGWYLEAGENGEMMLKLNWPKLQAGELHQLNLSYQVRIK